MEAGREEDVGPRENKQANTYLTYLGRVVVLIRTSRIVNVKVAERTRSCGTEPMPPPPIRMRAREEDELMCGCVEQRILYLIILCMHSFWIYKSLF